MFLRITSLRLFDLNLTLVIFAYVFIKGMSYLIVNISKFIFLTLLLTNILSEGGLIPESFSRWLQSPEKGAKLQS